MFPEDDKIECCEQITVHEETVSTVRKTIPEDEILYELADFFKVFGDSTRIKILYVLSQSPMCVCDIAELVSMSQSAISHQLRVLKQARLVKFKRDGKQVFYSLADNHITTIIQQGLTHIEE